MSSGELHAVSPVYMRRGGLGDILGDFHDILGPTPEPFEVEATVIVRGGVGRAQISVRLSYWSASRSSYCHYPETSAGLPKRSRDNAARVSRGQPRTVVSFA
jgi:hypothetical protein